MDAKDHIGNPIDLAFIRMRGDEAEETVEAGNGREGGRCLFGGKGAGGGEDASIHAATVVQQVAERCDRSTAGSLRLPATPLIGWGRLGEKGQAQWGTVQRRV
jgi:hypothetical protein